MTSFLWVRKPISANVFLVSYTIQPVKMISVLEIHSQAYLTLLLPGGRPPDAYAGGGG